MDNLTLHPMSNLMFDSITMDYNLMTDNMIDNLMANNLVVDNSKNNDLMAISEMAKGLMIDDSREDDSIDTPMIDSPMGNEATTNIMGSTASPAMTQSLSTTGPMADNSAATKKATSIFTPRLRESLRNQMLFVNGPRSTEGVWLCLQCMRHLDRDDDEETRKWHTRCGIYRGLELHPEARTKKLESTAFPANMNLNNIDANNQQKQQG
ncbi:hypothetical protein BHE90_006777 [Fusarium euwallaceae]|uniref:Uncharacterized protein n=1 Tax=Fusarium euwallaceae TaxID=1147111 RepID=A0A430LSP9_9HYPO|nr:hypothetical protein BHE90_006777 [Fusarium euwallaceae]